ncbi:MAG TPA: di-heme oxidoredictase family protein [Candidatus Acidoferrales bacterium]|nr:di-heme oxidoredictase family protein [Candidatus Acidoferrales bacterium]
MAKIPRIGATAGIVALLSLGAGLLLAQPQNSGSRAHDPGVRGGGVNAGQPLSTLSAEQISFFQDGQIRFMEVDSVSGTVSGEPGKGLGPGFNSNSCASCHAQPFVGGSSPSADAYPNIGPNPQIHAASDANAANMIPSFITADGPVRETRFPFMVTSSGRLSQTPDGGVHDIFTITGRSDAPGCTLAQPDYELMQQLDNVIFRIPTPVFGAGLMENIADSTILANMNANAQLKQRLGISGHPNTSGNDGTITRFGWKAQNKSLEVFAGEAYNVEMGVTNELFPNERGNVPSACLFNSTPEDSTNFTQSGTQIPSDVVGFSTFMRFLAPPAPSTKGIPGNPTPQSIQNGSNLFVQAHCDLCHTPVLKTAGSALTPGLDKQNAALFSDLLVHHMGAGLSDQVSQGAAGPDEFRTAPLWGAGQRIFFLHDGRATPANGGLLRAIQAHAGQGSEANGVIAFFNSLSEQQKQDLLNFLRSL